jgi:S-DNA-T family DNA segregation ATPase FtsK/SpoIIIE
MARRRKKFRRKKNPLDYISLPKIDLDPDTKKGIFIVLILAFGAISLLGLFNLAGSMGIYLSKAIIFLFGWGKWAAPLILLALGFFLYNDDKYYVRGTTYIGLFLFVISFQSLLHFFVEHDEWKNVIIAGDGGGYLGFIFASAFFKLIGFWGGLIVIIGLLIISFMVIFNAPLYSLVGSESWLARLFFHPVKFIFNKVFRRGEIEEGEDLPAQAGEEEEEGDDEEEDEDFEEEEEEEEEMGAGFTKHGLKEESAYAKDSADKPEFMNDDNLDRKLWKKSNVKIDLPFDLLNGKIGKPTSGDIKNNILIIQKALEHFGIPVEMGEVSVGPTVTQYTFKPHEGIKLSRITNLSNDLALALAAHPIRIEAPIPGKSLVGVEVPNQAKAIVGLKEILSDKEFKNRKTNLTIGIGKDVSGKGWMYDLAKMPHLLVAGATNSGKSVCLNSIIVSLLYQNNPDDLRFIMVDPKRVELPVYNGIPHLLTPVITEVSKTINALKWCLNEMDRRFEILSKAGKRNIQSYNSSVNGSRKNGAEKMPYIVFVVDELADLMVAAARDIEASVIRLAQMARAVGIHLVLATQRPSVDVITGLIKANMPARIAFSVASGVDSRTILDSLGAEKLLGRGDMLFITAELSKPKRLQGAFVSDSEIKKIVRYIREKGGDTDYVEGVTDRQKVSGIAGVGMNSGGEDDDELLEEAKELIINSGKASASFLQRRLSVGYARAARILDILEEQGVIGQSQGAKPREILISKEQYDSMVSQGVSGVALHSMEEAEAPEEYFDSPTDAKERQDEEDEDDEDLDDEEEDTPRDAKERQDEEEDSEDEEDEEEEEEGEDEEEEEEEDDEDEGRYFAK